MATISKYNIGNKIKNWSNIDNRWLSAIIIGVEKQLVRIKFTSSGVLECINVKNPNLINMQYCVSKCDSKCDSIAIVNLASPIAAPCYYFMKKN